MVPLEHKILDFARVLVEQGYQLHHIAQAMGIFYRAESGDMQGARYEDRLMIKKVKRAISLPEEDIAEQGE